MKFFTRPYHQWPYHLIPYPFWKRGYKKPYKEIIIDSGVNALINTSEYPYITDYPLRTQPHQRWVIPDYPFDLLPNLTQEECIEKTNKNLSKWKDHPNTIASIQYRYENIDSFSHWYDYWYSQLHQTIGIGNLCKSRKTSFLRQVIDYIIDNNPRNLPIHFFGLGKYAAQYLVACNPPFEYSMDNMKWDYRMHKQHEVGTIHNGSRARHQKMLEYIRDISVTAEEQ